MPRSRGTAKPTPLRTTLYNAKASLIGTKAPDGSEWQQTVLRGLHILLHYKPRTWTVTFSRPLCYPGHHEIRWMLEALGAPTGTELVSHPHERGDFFRVTATWSDEDVLPPGYAFPVPA